MDPGMVRAAIYYAPAPHDPLWAAACAWLGRDAETAAMVAQPAIPGIAELTADARLYGFHATLKPPMRLATDWHALMADAEALAAGIAPFSLPPLVVADLSGFLALRETVPCPALHSLADACVRELDRHRLPPNAAELARRRGGGLSPEREENLRRWGYPGVMAAWRFHMTLTRRLSEEERAVLRPVAESWLAEALAVPRRVDALCVFAQPAPGQPFMIAERLPLRG